MAVDWLKIKTEYINGRITHKELAKKYGISERQVSQHSRDEHWVQEREKHLSEISAEIQERASEKIIDIESECLAIKSRLKLKFYQEIERRMETAGDADGQELRRLVQNFKDMCDVRDTGGTEEKESPLAELIRNWKND